MSEYVDVAIVGASPVGAHVASTLREQGFTGSVMIIGEETNPPYDHPALSNAYMVGSISIERVLLRDPGYWDRNNIALTLGVRVTRLDSEHATLTLDDGRRIAFGQCVLATGETVRRLAYPGADLAGIHTVRSLADVDALRAALTGIPVGQIAKPLLN